MSKIYKFLLIFNFCGAQITEPSRKRKLVEEMYSYLEIGLPPASVRARAPREGSIEWLIMFFDTHHTWQWLPSTKLIPLGALS